MRCQLILHQGRLGSLVGFHAPTQSPPAMKSWIFKFSKVQSERGRQNKLPFCTFKGIMGQVCIHLLVSEIQAHYPRLNLLPAHTDAVFSGRCQIPAPLASGRAGNMKGTLGLQCKRLSEELIAKTLCTNGWNQELTGVLGFVPLSSGKGNISGQRKLITFLSIIFFFRDWRVFLVKQKYELTNVVIHLKSSKSQLCVGYSGMGRMWEQNSWVVFKCNILQESDTRMQINSPPALSPPQLFSALREDLMKEIWPTPF